MISFYVEMRGWKLKNYPFIEELIWAFTVTA
jgi:hypothetical protein